MTQASLRSEATQQEVNMTDFTVGAVHLNVRNLETMLRFYQHNIGLQVHQQNGKTAHLGVGAEDLLVLTETPDRQANRAVTGLFHFAILLPTRVHLAKTLSHFAGTQTRLQGLSDHVVSEAIYLADPDGNGIEIYRDRPREDWYRDGEFQLTTIPMDVNGVMSSLSAQDTTWEGLPTGTIMGHIHLHFANIPENEAFYRDVIGMDVMANMGSATFMSYDGYHHHLGGNIWGGRQIRTGQELGLAKYNLHLNDEDRLDSVLAAADAHGVAITDQDGRYMLADLSNNQILLQV